MTVPVERFVASVSRAVDWSRVAPALLLVGVPLLVPLITDLWLRLGLLLLVGWAIPGWLLARGWRLPGVGVHGLVLAAWGLGVCWLLGGALLAHYLPGPLLVWQLWGVYGIGGLALVFGLRPDTPLRRGQAGPALGRLGLDRVWIVGACILVGAMLLRLPGLGYHEFHTDEVVLLRQAAWSMAGNPAALAEHTKGPGEIAVILAVYRALGAIDEGTARFPFALMSIGSALATAWLGYRMFGGNFSGMFGGMFGGTVGPWAALLLLGNGFALGLSRIAQYQAGVLLLSALAVWAMWEFAQSGRARWLSLAGVFSAFGLVLHYEFGILAPALIYLAILGLRSGANGRGLWRTALLTGLGGALLLAVAYVPPLFNPYFSTTQSYLSNRLGATLVFNGPFFVEMGTFYNSTYFFVGLIGLVILGIGLGIGGKNDTRVLRLPTLVLCLWWLPFFVLYVFVVRYPGTHFYQMMTAWSLLGALPLAVLTRRLWDRWAGGEQEAATRRSGVLLALLGVGAVAWLAVSVFYLHLLFFRQNPEYLVNHEREGLAFYWAPFPVPQKPRFGFPIHAGWKTIGVLGEWGYLQGTYSGNDRSWGLREWYRGHLTWIEQWDGPDAPDFIFTARHIQEENLTYHDGYHDSYLRVGEVRLRGEPRIELWARAPLPVPYVTFDAEHFDAVFLREVARLPLSPSLFELGEHSAAAEDATRARYQRRVMPEDGRLGATVELTAAFVPEDGGIAGQVAHLTLVWLPHSPLTQDYKLFVHVADASGVPLAQWDGYPGLNTSRTSTWRVGEPFTDHVLLPLPADLAPGEYTLLAGLYDPASGERLGERAIPVTRLTVRAQ